MELLAIGLPVLVLCSVLNAYEINLLEVYFPYQQNAAICDRYFYQCSLLPFSNVHFKHTAVRNHAVSEIINVLTEDQDMFYLRFRIKPLTGNANILTVFKESSDKIFFGVKFEDDQLVVEYINKDGMQNSIKFDEKVFELDYWHYVILLYSNNKMTFFSDCMQMQSFEMQLQSSSNMNKDHMRLLVGMKIDGGRNIFKGELSGFTLSTSMNFGLYSTGPFCDKIQDSFRSGSFDSPDLMQSPFETNQIENNEVDGNIDPNQLHRILLLLKQVQKSQEYETKNIVDMKTYLADISAEDEKTNQVKNGNEINGVVGNLLLNNSIISNLVDDTCSLNPCHHLASCINIIEDPGYKCGSCPTGMEGDGKACTDVDECMFNPCSHITICTNTNPGYICSKCPRGFSGRTVYGRGKKFAIENKQNCVDVDECVQNTHNCAQNVQCTNTMGGYECGSCEDGYTKNNIGQCEATQICQGNPGTSKNPCSKYAKCSFVDSYLFGPVKKCKCNVGYAGNGFECGLDTDFDGFPDEKLPCTETNCLKDNCPAIPNSDQSNNDIDFMGDVCDEDDDNDGIDDEIDNCPFHVNIDQSDDDGDGIGNVCDNCLFQQNSNQNDQNDNKIGDECDDDIDGDGIQNIYDNCISIMNNAQYDQDNDMIGDACDNCPTIQNVDQYDTDLNGIGDACDHGFDSDKDGIVDVKDNCPKFPNAAQANNDNDNEGNYCDDDDDNDGFNDREDNCPLIHNLLQFDIDGNKQGDVCEYDYDDDGIDSRIDACPLNRFIWSTNLKTNYVINFNTRTTESIYSDESSWKILDKGRHVNQIKSNQSVILLGKNIYEGFNFNGVFFSNNDDSVGEMGIVFSYQSVNKYYSFLWSKKENIIQLKVTIKLANQTHHNNILWEQKMLLKSFTPYYYNLMHRPLEGTIRFKLQSDPSMIYLDTGYIRNDQLKGGRIGIYTKNQSNTIWSALNIACDDVAVN